jgi:hypothetical protein
MSSILKVDQLQDSGGNAIITSDGAGNLTTMKTNYPAFQARLSATTAMSDATITKVEFNTEEFDTDNYYDNSTNYRFTPLISGKYFIYAKYLFDTSATDLKVCSGYIYKNDALYTYANINFDANYAEGGFVTLNAIIDFNGSTDFVDGRVFVDSVSGSTVNLFGNSNETYFGAFRIGS